MVKGTTRQVIVVKGADQTLFDQAIFLVRDEALSTGGVTEEQLLQQARTVCRQKPVSRVLTNALYSAIGAVSVGLIWFISLIF